MKTTHILLVCAFMFALPSRALAQWQLDGTALSSAANYQSAPTVVSDGAGGAIVVWQDNRSGSNYDIYARRVNESGVPQWTADGVALCAAGGDQYNPAIVTDGAGGAIVTWTDYRGGFNNPDVYVQRVNASGVPQWTVNGVAICTAAFYQYAPTLVSDGAGGAIVTWYDLRSSGFYDIYAQRVNASGIPQWTANGVALCTATGDQSTPAITTDGAGGAIVSWSDHRGASYDIYAQRVGPSGAPLWTPNGVTVSIAGNDQAACAIASDGAGGAIVTWSDYRSGTADIYAQRINAAGGAQWTVDGIALCNATLNQSNPTIIPDGTGGAIVCWDDYRSDPNSDVYAQRINISGVLLWTANGVAICTANYSQYAARMATDGTGGAIVTWHDFRGSSSDIYAQRVGALGSPQWTANGVAICAAGNSQGNPTIVANGTDGAIVAWQDYRSGVATDIYAQRVSMDFGTWGQPEPRITSVSDIPHDQGGRVSVNWLASDLDKRPQQVITYYSVWRAVDLAAFSALASAGGSPPLVDASAIGPDFQGTAIRHERIATTDYYWEWVGNQTFRYTAGYSFSAATREDSLAGHTAVHYLQVLAHTGDPSVFWQSNVMSGYSVDNLAPPAPLFLTALRAGADVHLKWNRVHVADLKNYAVYRATSSGVTPIPANFLSTDTDTVLVDASAPAGALYYVVTAYDVHANQSKPSNQASVSATTGVGRTPAITALTVLQNHPNPFTATTEWEIGLPARSDISMEVYDVTGQRVSNRVLPARTAGWQLLRFDGRDDVGRVLASGVYFLRVSANGETITRKMVIAR